MSEERAARAKLRPAGLSPGAASFIGAWIVGLAIARLTGATAVILLLVAGLVGIGCALLGGWLNIRGASVTVVNAPDAATVDSATRLTIELHAADRLPGDARVQFSTTERFDTAVAEVDLADRDNMWADDGRNPTLRIGTNARFEQAGIIRQLTARVESPGPAGLIWWRRTITIPIQPIHVAPPACGPVLPIESRASRRDGSATSERGSHAGEIDGIRAWREGDPGEGIHWPSTLRAGSLIVHDRVAASDTTWLVPYEGHDQPAQLRWTLGEGLRQGHDVLLDIGSPSNQPIPVTSEVAAAYWSAELADRIKQNSKPATRTRRSGTRRRAAKLEQTASIDGCARVSAAVAAILALAMLLGALSAVALSALLAALGLVLGAAVSLHFARSGGERPLPLRIGVGLAAVGALAGIAAKADGVEGLLAALRGPMPNLLMLLVVLHGFEVTDRRTLRVHQAMIFVVAVYAAGLRIDGDLGWWMTAWGIAFAVSIMSTTRRSNPRPASFRAAREPVAVRRAGRRRSSVSRATGWIVAAGIVALAILSVVPIPDGPARLGLPALASNEHPAGTPGGLGGPADPTTPGNDPDPAERGAVGEAGGYRGFTETLDTSLRGDLGDDVVMRVRSPEPAFWRAQTFADFDGRTWRVSPDIGVPHGGPTIDVPPTLGDATGGGIEAKELVQTYFIETDLPNVVFAAYRPTRVIFDGNVWTRPDGALRSDITLGKGSAYTVVSSRLQVTPQILRSQGDIGAVFDEFARNDSTIDLEPFLRLPHSTTERTLELAANLRTPGESTYDTILAYQAWLAANTEYDLDAPVPAPGADAVDDYLFESRRGFCEQIASTLAVMLRSQGVPTRLASGYIPGERDRVSGVWKVRASDAHSWVEVWFPQTGWEAFDPTAQVPLAGDTSNGTVGGDLVGAAVSSIRSHAVELSLLGLVALVGWAGFQLFRRALRNRRRGRWGVLQDRFSALTPDLSAGAPPHTNPGIARRLGDELEDEVGPTTVAEALDRAAFDARWTDNDDAFEQIRSAVSTLERKARK